MGSFLVMLVSLFLNCILKAPSGSQKNFNLYAERPQIHLFTNPCGMRNDFALEFADLSV